MYYIILQRWEGEDTESSCMEYPPEKKDECMRMFTSLKKNAYQHKDRVEYRLVELDGEMQYAGKALQDWRKKNKVDKVIIQGGQITDNIPHLIEKDIKRA